MNEWFRSWHGAPTDPKWRTVGRRAGVRPGDVTAVVWVLLDRASQARERGSIAGYDPEVIADALGYEPDEVTRIVEALHDKGVLIDDAFASWSERQPAREDGSAERAKAWREQKKIEANASERTRTQMNARLDTDTDTDTDKKDTTSVEVVRATRATARRGTRLSADWMPEDAERAEAARLGFSEAQAATEFAKFRDYWIAKPGVGGVKLDWDATLRNWLRTSAERRGVAPATASPVSTGPPEGVPNFENEEEFQKWWISRREGRDAA